MATFKSGKPLSVGKHTIIACYCGDGDFAIAKATSMQLNVTERAQSQTSIQISSGAKPTATVTVQTPAAAPTGLITITANGKELARYTLGAASQSILLDLPSGTSTLTASYLGNNNFGASVGTVSVTVP